MLGSVPRFTLSDGLVCRVADDADDHHPHHPHKQDTFPAKPRKLVPDPHYTCHHGLRSLASIFSAGFFAGPCTPAGALLADLDADTACLCGPYAVGEGLVAQEEMDLDQHRRVASESATPSRDEVEDEDDDSEHQ